MDNSFNGAHTISKLHSMASFYVTTNPKLASLYMSQAQDLKKYLDMTLSLENVVCHFCGNIFVAGNHNVRVVSRLKISKSMKKILTKAAPILGKFKKKVKDMYAKSKNKMIIHCKVCLHRTVIKCMARTQKSFESSVDQSNHYHNSQSIKKKPSRILSFFSKKQRAEPMEQNNTTVDPTFCSLPTKTEVQLNIAPQCTSTPLLARKGKQEKYNYGQSHSINRTYTKCNHLDKSDYSNCSISSSDLSTSGIYSMASSCSSHDTLLTHAWDPSICGSKKKDKKNKKQSIHTSLQNMLDAEKQRQQAPTNSLYKFLTNL